MPNEIASLEIILEIRKSLISVVLSTMCCVIIADAKKLLESNAWINLDELPLQAIEETRNLIVVLSLS